MRRRIANGILPTSSKGGNIEKESGIKAGASCQKAVEPGEPWKQIKLPETRPSIWVPCLDSKHLYYFVCVAMREMKLLSGREVSAIYHMLQDS